MPHQHDQRGGALGTPHLHRLIQAARRNHGVVKAEGDVCDLGRVSAQCGQQLTCTTGPHLQQVIVSSLSHNHEKHFAYNQTESCKLLRVNFKQNVQKEKQNYNLTLTVTTHWPV